MFLELRVKKSLKKDKLTGEELLDKNGRFTYMSLRTLLDLRTISSYLVSSSAMQSDQRRFKLIAA